LETTVRRREGREPEKRKGRMVLSGEKVGGGLYKGRRKSFFGTLAKNTNSQTRQNSMSQNKTIWFPELVGSWQKGKEELYASGRIPPPTRLGGGNTLKQNEGPRRGDSRARNYWKEERLDQMPRWLRPTSSHRGGKYKGKIPSEKAKIHKSEESYYTAKAR